MVGRLMLLRRITSRPREPAVDARPARRLGPSHRRRPPAALRRFVGL